MQRRQPLFAITRTAHTHTHTLTHSHTQHVHDIIISEGLIIQQLFFCLFCFWFGFGNRGGVGVCFSHLLRLGDPAGYRGWWHTQLQGVLKRRKKGSTFGVHKQPTKRLQKNDYQQGFDTTN